MKKNSLFNFNIPAEFKDVIAKKNRFILKILFSVSFVFGLILSISNIFFNKNASTVENVYYLSYIVLGVLGLALTFLKAPVPFIQAIVLVFIDYIFIILLKDGNIRNTIIIYLVLMFVYIMTMEVNPFMFVAVMFAYIVTTIVLFRIGMFEKVQNQQFSFIGNIILILFLVFYLVFWKRHHIINQLYRERTLEQEQEKTEILLQNIFPPKIIQKLKQDGKVPPENFENVTVLFSDIVDFTKSSSSLEPDVVINELNDLFTEFDKITEKNECMRIKTIGDAYLAVCGLPEKNEKHAERLIQCAKEYIEYMEKRNQTAEIKWNIRVGIDSGSAIAGIIGQKKYVYDILGSTVDTAVELQRACKPMRIAVSQQTYDLIKDVLTLDQRSEIDLIS